MHHGFFLINIFLSPDDEMIMLNLSDSMLLLQPHYFVTFLPTLLIVSTCCVCAQLSVSADVNIFSCNINPRGLRGCFYWHLPHIVGSLFTAYGVRVGMNYCVCSERGRRWCCVHQRYFYCEYQSRTSIFLTLSDYDYDTVVKVHVCTQICVYPAVCVSVLWSVSVRGSEVDGCLVFSMSCPLLPPPAADWARSFPPGPLIGQTDAGCSLWAEAPVHRQLLTG